MVRLLLVRHGEPRVDRNVSAAAWPLTERGRERASALAHTLAVWSEATEVWSSPQCKARETAALALPRVTAAVRNELVEVGRPWHSSAGEHEAAASEYLTGREVAGWEPHAEVLHRLKAIERDLPPNGCVAVVSQGVLLTTWLARAVGLEEPARFWRDLLLPDAWAVDLATRAAVRLEAT